MNFFALGIEILHAKFFFALNLLLVARRSLAGNTAKPANRGIVIMGAGIDNNILVIVMWQVVILRIAAETKLQNAHAWKTEVVAQSFNIGRDHTQVFSNYRQLAQRRSDCQK